MIEITPDKELPAFIKVCEGESVSHVEIIYDWKPLICTCCKCFGHTTEQCDINNNDQNNAVLEVDAEAINKNQVNREHTTSRKQAIHNEDFDEKGKKKSMNTFKAVHRNKGFHKKQFSQQSSFQVSNTTSMHASDPIQTLQHNISSQSKHQPDAHTSTLRYNMQPTSCTNKLALGPDMNKTTNLSTANDMFAAAATFNKFAILANSEVMDLHAEIHAT